MKNGLSNTMHSQQSQGAKPTGELQALWTSRPRTLFFDPRLQDWQRPGTSNTTAPPAES